MNGTETNLGQAFKVDVLVLGLEPEGAAWRGDVDVALVEKGKLERCGRVWTGTILLGRNACRPVAMCAPNATDGHRSVSAYDKAGGYY